MDIIKKIKKVNNDDQTSEDAKIFIKKEKTSQEIGFFDLSSREQKKIIKEAAKNAN